MRSNALVHAYLPLCMNFMAHSVNNYHICANACLKSSKPLMSARQAFVAFLTVLRVGAFERCVCRVWITDRESCEVQVRMRKGITAHARLKKEAYQPRKQKSIALAG